MKRLAPLAAAAAILVPALFPGPAAQTLVAFERDRVAIRSGDREHPFRVEIARTDRQQRQGLMHRTRMDADAGMLFLYRGAARRAMWMKNTRLPLDMLFLGAGGTVVDIVQRTVPLSTRTIVSRRPAVAVLELNAGTVARLGIREGDRVISRHLPGPP